MNLRLMPKAKESGAGGGVVDGDGGGGDAGQMKSTEAAMTRFNFVNRPQYVGVRP